MKKLTYVVLAAGLFACDNKKQEKTFEIEGVVKNASAKLVYLEENVPAGQLTIIDSAQLTNGTFKFKTAAKEESLYQLRLSDKSTPFALLINDAAKIKLSADVENAAQPYSVEGSPASVALISFDKTIYDIGSKLFAAGSRRDSLQRAMASDSLVSVEHKKTELFSDSLKSFVRNFLSKSGSPVLTLYAISSFQNTAGNLGMSGLSSSEVSEAINAASARFPDHSVLQNVKKSVTAQNEVKKNFSVRPAADFSQPGVDGKPVSLSSFKGKYVLLDFWASWCKPCRIDNPNVVKAYREFKEKNFTVFGVSLDKDREAWLEAIKKDGLTWTHASDLKYWSNEAASLYGVQSIPANFLIDPQGNIIAQDLHGEDIVNTLRTFIK